MGKTRSRKSDGDGETTRADRKFEKKVQFYEGIRSTVAQKTISKEKKQKMRSRQKKMKAYDMSALSDYLPELKAPAESKPAELKLNCKNRNKLLLREDNHMKTVVSDPVFQSDPLTAIYQHLLSTIDFDEKPKRKDGKTGKKKSKKKKSKASGLQSMEI